LLLRGLRAGLADPASTERAAQEDDGGGEKQGEGETWLVALPYPDGARAWLTIGHALERAPSGDKLVTETADESLFLSVTPETACRVSLVAA